MEVEAWTDGSLHSASVGSNPSVYGVSITRVIEILLTVPFRQSQHREQPRRRADRTKKNGEQLCVTEKSIVLGHKTGLGIDGRPNVCVVGPLVGGAVWARWEFGGKNIFQILKPMIKSRSWGLAPLPADQGSHTGTYSHSKSHIILPSPYHTAPLTNTHMFRPAFGCAQHPKAGRYCCTNYFIRS